MSSLFVFNIAPSVFIKINDKMIIGRLHTRRPVYTHEWSLCDYGMQTSESGYEQPDHGSIYSVESTTGSKNMANCRMHRNSTNQFHRIKLIEWSSNAQPSACPTEGTHVRQRTWKASKGDFLSRKLSSRRIHSKRLPNRRLTSRRLPMRLRERSLNHLNI